MPTEQNKLIVRRIFDVAWSQGDLSVVNQVMSPSYIHHDPAQPRVKTLRDYEQQIVAFRRAFPDLRFVVEDQIAERDLVMTWWGAQGTHRGTFAGITPTDKHCMVTGISLSLCQNGRIIEGRVNWDALGLYQQLGILPNVVTTGLPGDVGVAQSALTDFGTR